MVTDFTRITDESPSPGAQEHMVRMRDGVRLATDVYLPEHWDNGPTVLVRLPYDKSSRYVFFTIVAPMFNARGYAVAVQDVRGKFRSEGETRAFVHETNDGYDTIEWIVRQGWSDGKVAMFGDSYYGFTQWAAVASQHPALRAIVPRVTSANLGNRSAHATNRDGRSRRLATMWEPLYLSQIWVDNDSFEYMPDFARRPVSSIFEDAFATIGERSLYLDSIAPRDAGAAVYPGPHPFDTKPLPVLHVVGWFDNLKGPSMDDYTTLAGRAAWAPLQYLWVDSTDHEGYRLPDAPVAPENDHGVDDDALGRHLAKYVDPAADFFDVFVRETRPASSLPRVQWHLGHGEEASQLRTSDTWPPAGVETRELFLGDAGRATSGAAGGRLSSEPQDESSATWNHDPDDLVPFTVENPFASLFDYPDESAVNARPDVVTFTSEPVAADLDLVGPVDVTLTVGSTAPTTDLVVKVLDVDSGGAAHVVAWGDGQVDTLDGDAEATIDLGHVAYRLRAGHALRLQIASSEYPAFQPNPGTDEPAWSATMVRPSSQTLRCSDRSVVRLSVLPSGAAW